MFKFLSGDTTSEATKLMNSRLILKSRLNKLALPTYEGSGQAVHPSVQYIPNGLGGYKYWMAFTPYPNSNDDYENPSILASNDGDNWVVPAGLTNPIDQPSAAVITAGGHMSDVELVYDKTNRKLILYYRYQTQPDNVNTGVLLRRTSTNGITWSSSTQCTIDRDPISPSIDYRDVGSYDLWMGSGDYMYRASSTDGITFQASIVCRTNLDHEGVLWHPSVWRDAGGYKCLVAAYTRNVPNIQTSLYYGTSVDGWTWNFDSIPVIDEQKDDTFDFRIYRSCAVPFEDGYRIYASGANNKGVQSIGCAIAIIKPDTVCPSDVLPSLLTVDRTEFAPLASGAQWMGKTFNTVGYDKIIVNLKTDTNTTAVVQQSIDGLLWSYGSEISSNGTANVALVIEQNVYLPFARVYVNNSATVQTYFATYVHLKK